MSKGLVTVFGGSGFLGRYATRALVKEGWRVRIACRRPNLAGDARLAGAPGWVDIMQVNVGNVPSIERALEGADAAVNLVGILHERGNQKFAKVQRDGAANIAQAAAKLGVPRLVHVSAIGADAQSDARYARTKGEGEALVREAMPSAVILRPSAVFGPEDTFFNRFAGLARSAPILPAIGGGKTRLQPLYAGDMANAIAAAVEQVEASGQAYELGGPRTYSMNEIFDFITKTIDRPRLKMPLPMLIAQPLGYLLGGLWHYVPPFSWGFVGEPPLTGNQVQMLRADNVVSEGTLGMSDLGLTELESVESIVPSYLWRFRPYGEFQQRREA
ncbi:MAG: complex I NDUFA9 subunit family protein [Hyphomonadaceae bacterium]